eukprot:1275315-Rhodomonas_salina.2
MTGSEQFWVVLWCAQQMYQNRSVYRSKSDFSGLASARWGRKRTVVEKCPVVTVLALRSEGRTPQACEEAVRSREVQGHEG